MKSFSYNLHSSIYTQSSKQRKYKVQINSTRFRNQLASNMHNSTHQRSFPLPSSLQIVTSYSIMNSQFQYETNNTKIGKFGENGKMVKISLRKTLSKSENFWWKNITHNIGNPNMKTVSEKELKWNHNPNFSKFLLFFKNPN